MVMGIAFIAMIAIAGAAVLVGLREEKNKAQSSSPRARSNRDKMNALRLSGGLPDRKEN